MNVRTKKFLSYYRPYLGMLMADLACAVVVSAVVLLLPLCARIITGDILASDAPDALRRILQMGGIMLTLVAIHTACNIYIDYQGHLMGAYMESDMRRELFDHLQALSFRFYDEQRTGQLMARLTNDLFYLSELFHHGPEDAIISLLKFVGTFVILFTINPTLTLIIFLFVPVMTLYAFVFYRRMQRAMRRSMARIGDINAQVEDTLSGIRVVQSFGNQSLERTKFAEANASFVASRRKGYRSEGLFYGGMMAFTHLLTVAMVVLGGISILLANLTLPDLITYLLYVAILVEPLQRWINLARLQQEGMTGFERFMDILAIAPEIADAPDAIPLPPVAGRIRFEDVTFGYSAETRPIFTAFNLDIRAGEYVALVGYSGVGKTTLCALIPRFYDIDLGRVLIDEIDVRTLQLQSLRQQIGIVQQDVYLFAGSVADNIRYGKPNASLDDVVAAAKQADAHAFITALPNGYDTDIGQRGVKLSGGQKQRLSIARVFLKNPPILLFDEATSALDNESETAVQHALERLRQQRTLVVIAHRLSTIRNADRIVVLGKDGIVEQGSHEALLLRGGAYAELCQVALKT